MNWLSTGRGPVARNLHRGERAQEEAFSSVFMRVRRTAPMFTFNSSRRFVNEKYGISTDICWFRPKVCRNSPIF